MTDAPEREIAYQTYINEVTSNGNTRLTNIILSNAGDRAEQHLATQIDLAFQAGWSARADLATPLDDPRVKALVEALREYACDCGYACEQLNGTCGDTARATLAELKGEKE